MKKKELNFRSYKKVYCKENDKIQNKNKYFIKIIEITIIHVIFCYNYKMSL